METENIQLASKLANEMCEFLNVKRKEFFNNDNYVTDVFDFQIGKKYVKIGFRHSNSVKLFSAEGFIEPYSMTFYTAGGWSKPNKNYPLKLNSDNVEIIAKRMYPYIF